MLFYILGIVTIYGKQNDFQRYPKELKKKWGYGMAMIHPVVTGQTNGIETLLLGPYELPKTCDKDLHKQVRVKRGRQKQH